MVRGRGSGDYGVVVIGVVVWGSVGYGEWCL